MTWPEGCVHAFVWASCAAMGVVGALPGWGALVGALVGSAMMKRR